MESLIYPNHSVRPLYLTSHSDPHSEVPIFISDGETEAWGLTCFPKTTHLSEQQSQDSNTHQNNYSKSQAFL